MPDASTTTRRARGRPSTSGATVMYGSSIRYQRNRRQPPANKKNMMKTSRKGAYKKARKKQMAIRRAPLVETFKYQSAPGTNQFVRLSRTSAYNMLLNDAFCAGFTQGLDTPNDGLSTLVNAGPTCRGRDIYSKLTAMKLRFDFPEDQWSIRDNYTAPTVYHGWIKKTMFKTSDTTPPPVQVVRQTFIDMINHELENQFDEANDKLDFRDRRPSQYVILGKKSIMPNRNKSIAIPLIHVGDHQSGGPSAGDPFNDNSGMRGALPPVFHTVKWNVNRKIGLQASMSWADSAGQGPPRFYPSDCWLPFLVIYNPSFVKQIQDDTNQNGQILVSYNSVHYYTDS